MNYEKELRNSSGKAEALANRVNAFKKTFLIMRSEYESILIAIGYRMERAITKVKTVVK
ncbi:hypothetical protein ACPJHH_13060 [Bacillus altitudinis]|uniref:hypothetical protein n=1 Tax=Bacillus altitudinis TaxID=293387 RepID=UPI003D0E2CCE